MKATYYVKVAVFLLYALLIGYLSLLDGTEPGTEVLDLKTYEIDYLDKMLHFAAYAVFSILAMFISKTKKQLVSLCIGLVLYGLVLELMQGLMPLREASVADFIANTAGIIVSVVFMTKANSLVERCMAY